MTTSSLPVAEQTIGADFHEHTVGIDGFTVRYLEAGAGDPVVVLHGAGGPRLSRALDRLAERFRVLLFEIPGFGTQVNEKHQSLTELADALTQAMDAVGLDRFHLLGTSFGGAVATHLALTHEDRLISLVLDAPAVFREGGISPAADVAPEVMLRAFRVHPERAPAFGPPDPEYAARTWALVDRLLMSRSNYDQEMAARISEIGVRTLVLFGDRDGIVPPENGRIWRRLLPNCSLILIHDAAHDIQGDRAEAFADVVGDWLGRGWQFLLPEQDTLINP